MIQNDSKSFQSELLHAHTKAWQPSVQNDAQKTNTYVGHEPCLGCQEIHLGCQALVRASKFSWFLVFRSSTEKYRWIWWVVRFFGDLERSRITTLFSKNTDFIFENILDLSLSFCGWSATKKYDEIRWQWCTDICQYMYWHFDVLTDFVTCGEHFEPVWSHFWNHLSFTSDKCNGIVYFWNDVLSA